MDTNRDEPSAADRRDRRRWLIGLSISVVFGLFGVVMTLLSYSHLSQPAAPPSVKAGAARGPAPVTEPARRERNKGGRHKD